MIHFGYNRFWGSLRKNNVLKAPRKDKIFLDKRAFKSFVHGQLNDLSNLKTSEVLRDGKKKHVFEKIKTKEFYGLVGKEYCCKSNKEGGFHYMDNIKISHSLADLFLRYEWVVVEWDKNGNRARARPPFV